MKQQSKIKETPNTLLPTMKGIEDVLAKNEKTGLECRTAGEQLWRRIEARGVNEIAADEVRAYLFRAASEVQQMMAARKPFTDRLRAVCAQFTSLENAIDPKKDASPAYRCQRALAAYLKSKRAAAETTRKQLEENLVHSQKRAESRKGWNESQRQAALSRAEERYTEGLRSLAQQTVEVELIPRPTSPDGYVELFKFWWENVGQNLSTDDLDRIFHPMLMYAKKQAAKGIFIHNEFVNYMEEPKVA